MKSLPKKKKLVNHVVYLVDCSGSMFGRMRQMEKMVKDFIDTEVVTAEKEKQETKLSLFLFGNTLRPVFTNCPSTGFSHTPSFSNLGGTALIRSTLEAIKMVSACMDNRHDNAVVFRIITDGQETEQRHGSPLLRQTLDALNDDWTMAILVPDKFCEQQAISYGFPDGNIQIWDINTDKGMEDMGSTICASTQSFYSMRSVGTKSTKTLFKLNEVNKTEVKQKLEEVNPSEYQTLIVRAYDDGKAIKDFVESWTKEAYRVGSAYYQLSKPEKIQAGKVIAVVDKQTGKMYSGVNARKLLGLPNAEVKVAAADFLKFDVFVQSHSTNRKLVKDTHLIVFK